MKHRKENSGSTKLPASRYAPEPEGPEEISRRFQRMNRPMDLSGLPKRLASSSKKLLYTTIVVAEIAAIVLGILFEVPFMDTLAMLLPALLVIFLGDSKDETSSKPRDGDGIFERLLKRFGVPPDENPHRTDGR